MAKWFSCGSKKAADAVAEPSATSDVKHENGTKAETDGSAADASAAPVSVAVATVAAETKKEELEERKKAAATPPTGSSAAAIAEPSASAPATGAVEEAKTATSTSGDALTAGSAPSPTKKGASTGFFAKLTQIIGGSKTGLNEPLFPNQQIIFVLGQPGSGKGTQCANVGQHFGFVHISAGDLLREEVTRASEHGKLIDEHIREGKIVPVDITLGLLKQAMHKQETAKGFLIDGFPRQLDQADAFEATIRAPDFILFFNCPEEVLMQRLLKRGETSGRVDDNEESIKKRFKTFKDISSKCVERYSKQGKVAEVDAALDVDAVWTATERALVERGIARPEQAIINAEIAKE